MQFRGRMQFVAAGSAAAATLALAACSSSSSPPSSSLSGTVNASGSTFQLTFQQAAISAFKSVQPGITVNYNGVGSGTGRSNLASNTVLFAGSDSPIPASEQADFKGKKVLYFPVIVGPITLSYNLPGVSDLKLTPKLVAQIFQGEIKNWDDPAIKNVNPGVSLPATSITLAVRSDSSGTTQNFSLFLTKAAQGTWKLGSDSTIKWPPIARAAAGNGGVASVIKATQGAIGYVDYTDAKAAGLAYASVQNSAGDYVLPSAASASASAGSVAVAPDLTFAAVWGSGAAAYPITYQSWDLVYAKQPSAKDAALLKAYLGYLLGAGQQLLPSLNYAPLPASIDKKAVAQLDQITS